MMTIIENIIDELNNYILSLREKKKITNNSFLSLAVSIEDRQFRAYKKVTCRLILVVPGGTNQEIYSSILTGNFSVEADKKRLYEALNHNLTTVVFDMIRQDLDKLINGNFL